MAVKVEQLITDHLDLWTQAQTAKSSSGRGSNNKIELTGIKKLRELILELAVRGKLVSQDQNDEPASELLKRITAEKEALVKAGKLKKQKPLLTISDEEKPFELPSGWEWARLGYAATYGSSVKAETKDADENTWVLELEDIEKETSRLIKKVRFSDREFKSTKSQFNTGDVLYGKLRPYLDKVIVADESGVCTTEIIPINCYGKFSPYYLRWMLKTPRFIKYADESTHGMNMPRLGTDKAEMALVAVAPVSEQNRIVAKVDELMALCDQLEQQSYQQLDAHNQLVDALLAILTQSQNADELASNWQRLAAHFDELFITEYSISALKQTILQLAVMGKLVKQDPSDEPASELLKRIAAEKDVLVKAGKIKKQKPLPPISNEEKPFELPEGWEWCRFNDFISLISGQHLKPEEYLLQRENDSVPYITGPAEFGELFPTYDKYTFEKRAVAATGDVLVTCKGAGLGKLNIANCEIAISRQLMAVRAVLVDSKYVTLTLSSLYEYFQSKGVGIAIPGISREDILEKRCALPPLAEQKRIVIKVNELIELCDGMYKKLDAIRQNKAVLAEALVEQVVA